MAALNAINAVRYPLNKISLRFVLVRFLWKEAEPFSDKIGYMKRLVGKSTNANNLRTTKQD